MAESKIEELKFRKIRHRNPPSPSVFVPWGLRTNKKAMARQGGGGQIIPLYENGETNRKIHT